MVAGPSHARRRSRAHVAWIRSVVARWRRRCTVSDADAPDTASCTAVCFHGQCVRSRSPRRLLLVDAPAHRTLAAYRPRATRQSTLTVDLICHFFCAQTTPFATVNKRIQKMTSDVKEVLISYVLNAGRPIVDVTPMPQLVTLRSPILTAVKSYHARQRPPATI